MTYDVFGGTLNLALYLSYIQVCIINTRGLIEVTRAAAMCANKSSPEHILRNFFTG